MQESALYVSPVPQAAGSSEERVRKDLEALLDQFFSHTVTNEQRLKLSTYVSGSVTTSNITDLTSSPLYPRVLPFSILHLPCSSPNLPPLSPTIPPSPSLHLLSPNSRTLPLLQMSYWRALPSSRGCGSGDTASTSSRLPPITISSCTLSTS